MHVRTGVPSDLPGVRRIQQLAPEAALWLPEDSDFFVAVDEEVIAGFLVWRATAPDEIEILNLAVDPAQRRRGVARALVCEVPREVPHAAIFLEVRESNHAARALYRAAGFSDVGERPRYYRDPVEKAIVMRMQS
jgi:ribosomal-protein-alanine N-acetyltransferase